MARLKAVLLVLVVALQAGCLHAVPTDEYSYVIDIGVEKGEVLPYRFSFMVNNPSGGSGASASKENVTVISAEANDLYEAADVLAASSPNRLNFARTTLLLFSRELAENGQIVDVIDLTYGKLKIRESCRVMVTPDPIKDTFEGMVSSADPSMTKIKAHVRDIVELSGWTSDATLGQLLDAFSSKTFDAAIPYAGMNKGVPIGDMAGGDSYPYLGGALLLESILQTSFAGAAVFANERMVGILDGQNTMLLQMARGEFSAGRIQMPFGDTVLTLTLYDNGGSNVRIEGDTAVVRVGLEAALERPLRLPGTNRAELESAIVAYLTMRAENVFSALQKADSDALGLGRAKVMQYTDMGAWRLTDWDTMYRNLSASFLFSVKLSHDPYDLALE